MRMILLATSAMTLVACTSAMAVDSAAMPTFPDFEELDINDDLYIDPQEFELFNERMREAARERFAGRRARGGHEPGDWAARLYYEADADGDDLLNEYEYGQLLESISSMRERMRERMRQRPNAQ